MISPTQAFWLSGTLKGAADALFKTSQPGNLALDWFALGLNNYEDMYGRGAKASLPAWSEAKDLDSLFTTVQTKYKTGPLFLAINATSDEVKFTILSHINAALEERLAVAYSQFSGKVGQAGAHMWLLLRNLKERLEETLPGMRPESAPSPLKLIPLNQTTAATGRRLAGWWEVGFGGGKTGRQAG